MIHLTRIFCLLTVLLASTASHAVPTTVILEIDADASFVEGCSGFGIGCDSAGVSGQIRLQFDQALGTASLEYLAVEVAPIFDLPPSPISLATSLLFDAEGFPGVRLPTLTPEFAWNFSGMSNGQAADLLLVFPSLLPAGAIVDFSFAGGWDQSLVDGPSARIFLVGTVVPEPQSALLLGLGLTGLALRRTRSNTQVPDEARVSDFSLVE